jgi:outer membrane protein assembly factor BamE (lipoprotein component of BamABCDE complex)
MDDDPFPKTNRVRLVPILIASALILLFAFVILFRSQNLWISEARNQRLHPGMTKEEVRRLFGAPAESRNQRWIYRPFVALEDLQIDFDDSGRVTSFAWFD